MATQFMLNPEQTAKNTNFQWRGAQTAASGDQRDSSGRQEEVRQKLSKAFFRKLEKLELLEPAQPDFEERKQ